MDRRSRPLVARPSNGAGHRSVNTASKAPCGKFLCGLRVVTKPESSKWRFTLTEYFVLCGASNTEVLSQLFDILDKGEARYDEVDPQEFIATSKTAPDIKVAPVRPGWLSPRGEAFLNGDDMEAYDERQRIGSTEPSPRRVPSTISMRSYAIIDPPTDSSEVAPKKAVQHAPKKATKTARVAPGDLSDRGEAFLNGDSENESLIGIVDNVIRRRMAEQGRKVNVPRSGVDSLATRAGAVHPSTTDKAAATLSMANTKTRPLANQTLGHHIVPSRSNNFGLVVLRNASMARPDKETINCTVYVNKVTKKVFVRDTYRVVYRALTQGEADKIDALEFQKESEAAKGWDFMDDM